MTTTQTSYDVVIIGGGIMGASTAWFLSANPDFDGRVLVVERDSTYAKSSTMHTNSCMRQQFSTELNIRISQFAADFVKNLRGYIGDPEVPDLSIQNFGYLYLADNEGFADTLRANHALQKTCGAGTRLMTPDQIAAEYPFYNLDGIVLGSLNTVDEGYWDGITVFDWFRRSAKSRGVEYVEDEVVSINVTADRTKAESITLASGETVFGGQVVNAAGPRAAKVAAMIGADIPVEPRKRFTWIFEAQTPLDRPLPLTIDPSGVHVRQEGKHNYQAGGHADYDPAVDYDDFAMDASLWMEKIWPALAALIPAFEAIKVTYEWAGHYAYNTFDHNAIMGPDTRVSNFIYLNGFSGHGLQQAPAMGRGTAEFLTYGAYRSLDMTPFHFARIAAGAPIIERAVI